MKKEKKEITEIEYEKIISPFYLKFEKDISF
jgi:hypothetical protein